MYTSELEIVNSALIKVGAERIISLTSDTKSAKVCNELYPRIRDKMLYDHPWNFAIARVELGLLSTTPLFDYGYEHQLPADCLRVLKVYGNDDDWRVEGRKLLSNNDSVWIQYIRQVTDVTEFTPGFGEALALRLAAEISYSMTQSITLQDQLSKAAREELRSARSFNAQERSITTVGADDWVNVRL